MFLNPWYLQQQAAKAEQADNHNHNTINLNLEEEKVERSGEECVVVKDSEEVECPSPAPSVVSVVSAGSCGSGKHHHLHQLNIIQSSLKPGWTVHITPEGRLYYCK